MVEKFLFASVLVIVLLLAVIMNQRDALQLRGAQINEQDTELTTTRQNLGACQGTMRGDNNSAKFAPFW